MTAICSSVLSWALIPFAVVPANVSAQSPPCSTNASPRATLASRSFSVSHSPAKTSGGILASSAVTARTASGSGHSGCWAAGRLRQVSIFFLHSQFPSGALRMVVQFQAGRGEGVTDGVRGLVAALAAQPGPQREQRIHRGPEPVARIGQAVLGGLAETGDQAAQHRPGLPGALVLVGVGGPGVDGGVQVEDRRDHRGGVAVALGGLEAALDRLGQLGQREQVVVLVLVVGLVLVLVLALAELG